VKITRPLPIAFLLLTALFWLGSGAAFAVDTDGDGVDDDVDNCLLKYNPAQEDRNSDGAGDSCSNEIYVVPEAGFVNETTVAPGQAHSVKIHFIGKGFDCAPPGAHWACVNGWTIYSPDGADWDHLAAAVTPEFLAVTFGAIYRHHFHKAAGSGTWVRTAGNGTAPAVSDGSGADSAGFSLNIGFDGWVYPPWAGPALELEFASHSEDVGRHICIDTCKAFSTWEWACWAETSFPAWDHAPAVCYEIVKCCEGRVGDANKQGGDEPTISDVSILIDHLFISGTPLPCLEEADVNQSGGASPTEDDITISDISTLVYHMFIDDPEGVPLPECL